MVVVFHVGKIFKSKLFGRGEIWKFHDVPEWVEECVKLGHVVKIEEDELTSTEKFHIREYKPQVGMLNDRTTDAPSGETDNAVDAAPPDGDAGFGDE